MRRFLLLVFAVTLLSGSVAQAASYLKTDGTIVDPILDRFGMPHNYSDNNLGPGAYLDWANLTNANLIGVRSGGIVGIVYLPNYLPTNWQLTGVYLIGPVPNRQILELGNLDCKQRDLTNNRRGHGPLKVLLAY